MRADRNDLGDLVLLDVFQILFRELLKDEVVAQAACWISCALLLLEDAERGAQVVHHLSERSDDLATLWIIPSHTAKPQTVFLRSIEDGKLLLLNELGSLVARQPQGVAIFFHGQERVLCRSRLPRCRYSRCRAEGQ